MIRKNFANGVAAGLLISVSLLCISRLVADAPEQAAAPSKLVQSAQSALQAAEAGFAAGSTSADHIYHWSTRLMNAKRKENRDAKNAVNDHILRMRKLHEDVAAKYKGGAKGGDAETYHATIYYLAEAEGERSP